MLTSLLLHDSKSQVLREDANWLESCDAAIEALSNSLPEGLSAVEFMLDFEESAAESQPVFHVPEALAARMLKLGLTLRIVLHNRYVADFDRFAHSSRNFQLSLNYNARLAAYPAEEGEPVFSGAVEQADSSASLLEELTHMSSARWASAARRLDDGRADALWVQIPAGKWAYHELNVTEFGPNFLGMVDDHGWVLAIVPQHFHIYSQDLFGGDPAASPFANDPDGIPYSTRTGMEMGIGDGALAEWGIFGFDRQR